MSAATTAPIKPWLTTTEAAVILGKAPNTVWTWVQKQVIPKEHLLASGRRTYISRAWVMGGAV